MPRLIGPDNQLYFFRGRADVRRCASCGQLTDKWAEDLSIVPLPHAILFDFSYSYDGVVVVSRRFKDFVGEFNCGGLAFKALHGDAFSARATNVAQFDSVRRNTRFEKRCEMCGEFESVAGATPVFLRSGEIVPPNSFARTDIEFGSGDEKHPILLCDNAIAARLWQARFRGLEIADH